VVIGGRFDISIRGSGVPGAGWPVVSPAPVRDDHGMLTGVPLRPARKTNMIWTFRRGFELHNRDDGCELRCAPMTVLLTIEIWLLVNALVVVAMMPVER